MFLFFFFLYTSLNIYKKEGWDGGGGYINIIIIIILDLEQHAYKSIINNFILFGKQCKFNQLKKTLNWLLLS